MAIPVQGVPFNLDHTARERDLDVLAAVTTVNVHHDKSTRVAYNQTGWEPGRYPTGPSLVERQDRCAFALLHPT